MGLYDRQYYQDSYSSPWDSGGEYAPESERQRSIIITLIIINVAIFFLDLLTRVDGVYWLNNTLALKPAELFSAPWNIWQFFTYGFAHASINTKDSFFHVGGNMLWLYILGKPVEQRLGPAEFLKFYLIAVVVAGLGYFAINFNSPIGMVGASGAVSAVIALFIFFFPNSTLHMFGVFPIKTWILGVILVVVDLIRSLFPESHIAWEAHLTGFAFGAAYFHLKLNFQRLDFSGLTKLFSSRPKLKIHEPEKLKKEADLILEKINEHGEESLTAKERRTLKKYSAQIRNDRDS